ncbi:hypothetical protein [uncultured Nonlabens sp.]|uniref:hypothetical protein n=1 Tax=uncultured Nonlabens sp. TaxID=859306 RepID=UPI00260DF473|nr:hypothetical protein [uncultured Nonlabens sp.]
MKDKQLEKVRKGDFLLLPHYMKWVAILPVLCGIVLFFLKEYQQFLNDDVATSMAGHLILLGFLLIMLSRDKFPDERLLNLRHKAMAYAFIHGMILVIVTPFLTYLLSSLFRSGTELYFMDYGVFSIFIFQIMYLINYWRFKQDL